MQFYIENNQNKEEETQDLRNGNQQDLQNGH
jgi:hypothetical protein